MADRNGTPAPEQERLVFGVFFGPKGPRITCELPAREALQLLLSTTEDLREKLACDAVMAKLVASTAQSRIHVPK